MPSARSLTGADAPSTRRRADAGREGPKRRPQRSPGRRRSSLPATARTTSTAVSRPSPIASIWIVRAAQDRALAEGNSLHKAARHWPVLATAGVAVAAKPAGAKGGPQPARTARVEVRAGLVTIRRPSGRTANRADPERLTLGFVVVSEVDARLALSRRRGAADRHAAGGHRRRGRGGGAALSPALAHRGGVPRPQEGRARSAGQSGDRGAAAVQSRCQRARRQRSHPATGRCARRLAAAGDRRHRGRGESPQPLRSGRSWRVAPRASRTPGPRARSPGSRGSWRGWAVGTATIARRAPRQWPTAGVDSPSAWPASPPPNADMPSQQQGWKMCESGSHQGEGNSIEPATSDKQPLPRCVAPSIDRGAT